MGLLRILWYSNSPWAPTGYGTQTQQVVKRLRAAGHDVAIANNYGMQAGQSSWNDVPILSQGTDSYSRDVVLPHALAFEADWIITLYDVWIFQPRDAFRGPRWASWVPIDSQPVPPDVLAWCEEHYPIAMSKFGHRQLTERGVKARYVPHAIERDVYRPTPSDARQKLGIPEDAFLVLINAANKGANPSRKAWPEMLKAYAEFARRHDDVYLYLHTEMTGVFNGTALMPILAALGVSESRVRVAPAYEYNTNLISARQVAALYTAADVLLSTSMGEGFGLAVLEAQACGTPVIVTDFTAQPELVGAGWKVPYQEFWNAAQRTNWGMPLIPDIVNALEQSYAARGDSVLREAAIEFAAGYDADLVFERDWTPVLAELEALAKPPVKRQQRRAQARAQRKGRAA